MNFPTVKSLSLLRRAVLLLFVFAFAGFAARLDGQGCTVLAPTDFEPHPPGAGRPTSLSAAYETSLSLYRAGSGGPWRLLLQESFGYSVLDLSNPASPTAIRWDDFRYDASTPDSNPIPQHGDGQSYIQTVAVSPDGQRAAFSVNGPAEPTFHTMVGRADPNNGFGIWGDFGDSRASGTVVQQAGTRYIAYSILGTAPASAADVTTLPTTLGTLNVAGETTNWPAGTGLGIAGGFLFYITDTGAVEVIDASNPGPVGSITSGFRPLQIAKGTISDFGGRTQQYVAGAVDPGNPNKLWLLVALSQIIGQENSPSYGLISVTRDGSGNLSAPVSAGPAYRIPSVAGETWVNVGAASSLVVKNGTLYALMWSNRRAPSYQFGMFSTTVGAWGSAATVSTVTNPNFSVGSAMGFVDGPGTTLFGYAASGDAWVVPFSCASPDTPASSSLTVSNTSAGGAAVADGATVFVGDTLSIVPTVVPQPSQRPLVSWSFDFDFHAGNATEDAGTTPRVKNSDWNQQTSGPTPPAPITLVGPCDPTVSGSPTNGAGCWTSVLGNAASGGPDFTAVDPAGTTKPLKIAFEATNTLGISNTAVFTVNWKLPAARVASTQILSGQPLVSASDGHPVSYQWYFGQTSASLLVACGPSNSSCVPPANTSFYWLTATYANGYSTAPYVAGTTFLPFTVTSFVPAFTVNGASTGPITAYTFQTLLLQNNSQRGTGIAATYQYSLCQPAPCADNFVALPGMPDSAGGSTTVGPVAAGSYALKIKANYTGTSSGSAVWPDPATTPNGFPITVSAAPPPIVVSVAANPNPANHGDTVQLSCSATGGTGTYTAYSWSTTAGTFSSLQNPTFRATNTSQADVSLPATCTVFDTAGGQGLQTVNVTIHKAPTSAPITVNAYANGTTQAVVNAGASVTLGCSASGGSGSYGYAWSGLTGGTFSNNPTFTFTASNGTTQDVQSPYYCTVTDTSTGASGSNTAYVTVRGNGTPGPACTGVDYTLFDPQAQHAILPVGAGQFSAFQVIVGQVIQFIPTVSSFGGYSWTFGDGGASSLPSPQHAFQTGGTRTVTLNATGGNACAVPASYTVIVSGPTGNFSAGYEDSTTITYANVTAFKNIVFSAYDSPSAVDAFSWDFGDGTPHGSGPTATHGFAPGTWTVTLTVTKGTATVSQNLALTVIPPPEPPKWVIPGMASITSPLTGAHWQSDVAILNPHPTQSATYSVAFMDANNPYAALNWKQLTVPPLNSLASPNLLGDFFGQPDGSYGALIVRGDVAPLPPVITARTVNNGDPVKGSFGLSVPSMSVSGGVSSQASPAASVLIGLRQNASAYTNIGLVNLKTDSAKVQLDFFDGVSVSHLAQRVVDLAPYQALQISRALLDAGFVGTSDLYAVTVKLLSGTAVYPYATVIDVNSTDPIVVTPTEAPSNAYRVPGIIRLTGANGEKWRSRVTLTNPSGTGRKVHLNFSYVACNDNGCSNVNSTQGDVLMTSGQTQSWDDFVKVWLTVKGFIPVDDGTRYLNSFLDVTPAVGDPNQDPVIVLGETYNDTPTGHVGLQIPGYTPIDGATRTGSYKRLALTGLASTSSYRTNLALFVVAGTPGKWLSVHLYMPDGTKVRDVPVFVDGFNQPDNGTLFGGLTGDLSRLSVVVDNLDDGVTIGGYATVIDNKSGDSTFVKATPVP